MSLRRLLLTAAVLVCVGALALPAGTVSNAALLIDPTVTPTPGGSSGSRGGGSPGALPVIINEIYLADVPSQDVQYVGTDGEGLMYAATLKGEVYVLSMQGDLLKNWRIEAYLQDMKVDESGGIYVFTGFDVQKYDQDGNRLLTLKAPKFSTIEAIALTPEGNPVLLIIYADAKTGKQLNGLAVYDNQGKQIKLIEGILQSEIDSLSRLNADSLAVGIEGDFFIVETGQRSIVYHLDVEGALIAKFQPVGGPYSKSAVDDNGRFYISRYGKVHVVAPDHNLIGVVDLGVGSAYAITVAKNGNILVALQRNAQMANAQAEIAILGWQ
ncbi:MAG: hypothetical protein IAE83_14250 [Anaerolinea sp.]|nr:hypothetical protein [Anaerolinea sp.]